MRGKNAMLLLLFAIGFISMGTQIFLIREFFKVFGGNELVAGVVLSTWMLLTGAGAWMGRFITHPHKGLHRLLLSMVALAIFPVFIPIELAWLRIQLFQPGVAAGMVEVLAITAIVLLPFSLLNGVLYTHLGYHLWKQDERCPPSAAYTAESLGAVIAGGLVYFILMVLFDTYLSLWLISVCYLALISIAVCRLSTRRFFAGTMLLVIAIVAILGRTSSLNLSVYLRYHEQRVISCHETPYGEVVVTAGDHQLNYFENGLPLFSTGNVISNEERVHFAMSQHRKAMHVLVISGGYSGVLHEILKYAPRKIDYVELNPALSGVTGKFTMIPAPGVVTIHNADARRFIRTTTEKYDVVLGNMPEPASIQLNRYYTSEFLGALRQVLNPGAVVAFSLPTGNDYVSFKAAKLNGTLYHTLKSTFPHVIIAPASRNYFIASDNPLPGNFLSELEMKEVQTVYVNRYYFDPDQMAERAAGVMKSMPVEATVNRDHHPVAFFYQTDYLLSLLENHPVILILIFTGILLLVLLTLNPVSVAIFTGGFTISSIQVMLLVALQVCLGNMFRETGLVILASMCGLAAGSWLSEKMAVHKPLRLFLILQLLFAAFSMLLPVFILSFGSLSLPEWIALTAISLTAGSGSMFVGLEFGLAARIRAGNPAAANAENYPADLFGAAFGALLFTLFMFPFLGLIWSGVALAFFNIASAAFLFIRQRFFVPL